MNASLLKLKTYLISAYNCTKVKWYKQDMGESYEPAVQISPKRVNSTHNIRTHRVEDNGVYICEIEDRNKTVQGKVEVLIKAPPKVIIDVVKGISTTQIYLEWTVYAYNSKIKNYHLYYKNGSSSEYRLYVNDPRISETNTSFVMNGLQKSTKYSLRLEVQTEFAMSARNENLTKTVETLTFDPDFIPNISINGFSATSVTIGWKEPTEDIAPYIHYYILEAKKKFENISRRAYHSRNGKNLPYMFDNLQPHSTYIFKVCACSEYTNKCGNWSDEMEAATSDDTVR
ncbi:Protein tyrosine phosphatase [Operophtera brumata]|uniref:Protein tyrosine phosphatase n=1 Tax=Operophtera brumata TaxID=104452 RepID=A0A0L7LU72_OPEBR|nr:Protein tyrosine phosphatase [Operophtera brumata]